MNPLIDCPWRLVVSDLDGTLVTGTTALNHLGAWIGHEAIVEGLEDKFTRGEVSDREIAEGYAPFYGGVALADAVEVMSRIPSIDDIGLFAVLDELTPSTSHPPPPTPSQEHDR